MRQPPSLTPARLACTEALSSFGFQYLSETYLPLKLQEVRLRLGDDVLEAAESTSLARCVGRLDLKIQRQ